MVKNNFSEEQKSSIKTENVMIIYSSWKPIIEI
jgi:hypothetical protein